MSLSFVQITDHHLRHAESVLTHGYSTASAFRAVLRHIAEHVASQIDFVVLTGDIVDPGDDAGYGHLREMLDLQVEAPPPGPQRMTIEGLRDVPVYFLPGNHDDRASFFRHLFRDAEPMGRMNVTFQREGIQFICLDWGTEAKASAGPVLFDFLDRALRSDVPSVILTHHHVAPVGCRWLDEFLADDIGKFWEVVAGRRVLGILSGHVHTTYETVVRGIPVYGLRSTTFQFALQDKPLFCLQPPHYRYVTIRDGILTNRIFEVPI